MSTVMTVVPLEELEPNLVCSAEDVDSAFIDYHWLDFSIYDIVNFEFLVEGKQMSGKLAEMIHSDIYNPVRKTQI